MRAVDKEIVRHASGDFTTVFGNTTLQCAEKEDATLAKVYAIIGKSDGDYEVQVMFSGRATSSE